MPILPFFDGNCDGKMKDRTRTESECLLITHHRFTPLGINTRVFRHPEACIPSSVGMKRMNGCSWQHTMPRSSKILIKMSPASSFYAFLLVRWLPTVLLLLTPILLRSVPSIEALVIACHAHHEQVGRYRKTDGGYIQRASGEATAITIGDM